MDTSDPGLHILSNVCEWFVRHEKCVGEVSLFFQCELNARRIVSVPTEKNM